MYFYAARAYTCDQACENRPSEHKNCRYFPSLPYHNQITIYITTTKSSSLLQNLMGFLVVQLTEMEYYILNGR